MKSIMIVGMGKVGTAIAEMEKAAKSFVLLDDPLCGHVVPDSVKRVQIMHICIPYTTSFVRTVNSKVRKWKPMLTIIHSTVPCGTTEKIEKAVKRAVVHSPVRGQHNDLVRSVKIFRKIVGGNKVGVTMAENHLRNIGFDVVKFPSARAAELAKLISTTQFGWSILMAKETKALCDFFRVDPIYMKIEAISYNEGYEAAGLPKFRRPILKPPEGKIGGSCVSQNVDLLPDCMLKDVFKILNESRTKKIRIQKEKKS